MFGYTTFAYSRVEGTHYMRLLLVFIWVHKFIFNYLKKSIDFYLKIWYNIMVINNKARDRAIAANAALKNFLSNKREKVT